VAHLHGVLLVTRAVRRDGSLGEAADPIGQLADGVVERGLVAPRRAGSGIDQVVLLGEH
jgi:hypothetical protein